MAECDLANSSDDPDDDIFPTDEQLSLTRNDPATPSTRRKSEGLAEVVNSFATTPPELNLCLKQMGSKKKTRYNSCTFHSYHYGDSPPMKSSPVNSGVTQLLEGRLHMFKTKPLHPEAQVYRGRQFFSLDSRDVAIKIIPSHENRKKELELHKNLHHSNIVQLFDCGSYTGPIDFTYVVMELCNQNLEDYVTTNQNKPLDFQTCFSYSTHILDGLFYLRKQNIIHRDLRPSNILLADSGRTAKITDFKFARNSSSNDNLTTTSRLWEGTSGYRAPELLKSNNFTGSFRTDIFSYGLIVCYMFSKGKHPFGSNQYKWAANIIDGVPPDFTIISRLKQPPEKRQELLDLLAGCLQHRLNDRWTVEKLQQHRFFAYATNSKHRNSSKDRTQRTRTASETSPKTSQSCSTLANLDVTSREMLTESLKNASTKKGKPGRKSSAQSSVTQKCRRDLKLEFSDAADQDSQVPQKRNEIKKSLRKSISCLEFQEIANKVDELEQLRGYEDLDTALQMSGWELHLSRGKEGTSMQFVRDLLSSSPENIRYMAEDYSLRKRYRSALVLYRISTELYLIQSNPPDKVAEWIKRIANGISEACVRLSFDQLSQGVAVKHGANYVEELLQILRSTPNLCHDVASATESACNKLIDQIYRQSNDHSCPHSRDSTSRLARAHTAPNTLLSDRNQPSYD